MFLWTEIKWQIFRNKGRSILLCLIAALLTGAMAFYVGNIQSAGAALETLGDKLPVTVKCMSADGAASSGLFLNAAHLDAFTADVRSQRCTAAGAGAYTETARKETPFLGGDLSIVAANSLEALNLTKETFSPDLSSDFLAGTDPLCALREDFAQLHKIEVGSELSFPLYLHFMGTEYREIAPEARLTVEAIYPMSSGISGQMLLPIQWMREEAVRNGVVFFCYDSYSAVLADPLHLNEFKAKAREAGFAETNPDPADNYAEALLFEDELFINSAVKLQENIAVYRRFLIPFFGLIIALTTFVIFLMLRSDRRSMAVSSSLGCSRLRNGSSRFCSVFLVNLAGCAAALPILLRMSGLSLSGCLLSCGAFLLCGCMGTALALVFLLRFDVLELLTKAD